MADDIGVIPKKKKKPLDDTINGVVNGAIPLSTEPKGIAMLKKANEWFWKNTDPSKNKPDTTISDNNNYINSGGIGIKSPVIPSTFNNENLDNLFHGGVNYRPIINNATAEADKLRGYYTQPAIEPPKPVGFEIGKPAGEQYAPPTDPNRVFYGIDREAQREAIPGMVRTVNRQGHTWTQPDTVDLYGARDRSTMTPQEIEQERIEDAIYQSQQSANRDNWLNEQSYKEKELDRERAISQYNSDKDALDYQYKIDMRKARVGSKTAAEAVANEKAVTDRYSTLYGALKNPAALPGIERPEAIARTATPEEAGIGVRGTQAKIAQELAGIETPGERAAKLAEIEARTGEITRRTTAAPSNFEEMKEMLGIKKRGKDLRYDLLSKLIEAAPDMFTNEDGKLDTEKLKQVYSALPATADGTTAKSTYKDAFNGFGSQAEKEYYASAEMEAKKRGLIKND